jgi:POT family proton-dependent oligopeptide transporter
LSVLVAAVLWERYSFYSTMAILTLYMDEALRFDIDQIGRVYGGFVAAVYFMPLAGGLLADWRLGFSRAVVIGGVLMCLGHAGLALASRPLFYPALALLAAGSGLLKPNISTIVGNLYRDRPALRDAGYSIFYLGINLGAFAAPLAVAWIRTRHGWSAAFASAAAAMLVSLSVFVAMNSRIARASQRVGPGDVDPRHGGAPEARSPIGALLLIFIVSTVFWFAFYQIGLTLTFWARDNTRTALAPEAFQSLEPLGVIVCSPLAAALWMWLARRQRQPSTPTKMLMGILLVAAAYGIMATAAAIGGDGGRVSAVWLVATYLVIALGDIALSPMGLSLVNHLAPPRHRGLFMGGWFVSLAAGGYGAGMLGAYWPRLPHSLFFLSIVVVLLVAAALLMAVKDRIEVTISRAARVTA